MHLCSPACARPPAAPPTSFPIGHHPRPGLERLRRRHTAGEPVPLATVFRAAGLTAAERHVLRARLAGRSYGQIAAGAALRKPDGSPYTRQRVQQIERHAAAKLGLGRSLEAAIHAAERVDWALDLVERGGQVRVADLRLDPAAVRPRWQSRLARWERAHEAAVRAFLEEAEHARRAGASPALIAEVCPGG
jgi:hypothetical protein